MIEGIHELVLGDYVIYVGNRESSWIRARYSFTIEHIDALVFWTLPLWPDHQLVRK
jgi:hypothetical protein